MTTTTEASAPETHVVDVRVGPQAKAPKPAGEAAPAAAKTVVNARPAAALLGNTALVGGATVYAAAGAAGLLAAGLATGGVAVATVAAVATRKARANKAATGSMLRSASRQTKTSGGGMPGMPKSAGGKTSGGSGSGKPSASRGGSGKTGTLGKLGRAFGGGSSGKQASSSAGSAPSGKLASGARKTAGAIGRGIAGPFRALRNAGKGVSGSTTARGSASSARQAAKDRAKARGARTTWWRGWGSWLLGLGAGGVRWGWRKIRPKKPAAEAKKPAKPKTTPDVDTEVRRVPEDGRAAPELRPVPDAAPKPFDALPDPVRPAPQPVTPSGGSDMSRQLLALSEEMVIAAGKYDPDGMLEYAEFLKLYPVILDNVARACDKVARNAADGLDVHQVIPDTLETVHKSCLAVVGAAEQASPALERIHAEKLDSLRNPRPGAEKWDQRANRGY